jgi:saccharopine dehydrogenase-like NADP-dependent oxidoreductase
MMNGKILIVGGYGGVGQHIATTLAEHFPQEVIVAGRNLQKAQQFVAKIANKALAIKLDITNLNEVAGVLGDEINLVVMCVEEQSSQFAEQCIDRGINYIDIAATHTLLSQIELLDHKAKQSGATVALSVGLAPGITNLLASHCVQKLEQVDHLDIFILLGMGEVHGESSNQWMLDNLNTSYLLQQADEKKLVQSFEQYKQTIFSDGIGKRSAFCFNFSDQHIVVKTLAIKSAATWACFDSAFFGWLIYLEKKLGLLNLLRLNWFKKIALKLLNKLHFGSDIFIINVVANGSVNGKAMIYSCGVSGREEGRITGLVAAEVAEQMVFNTMPAGVFHIEQLFTQPKQFIEELSKQTIGLDCRFE